MGIEREIYPVAFPEERLIPVEERRWPVVLIQRGDDWASLENAQLISQMISWEAKPLPGRLTGNMLSWEPEKILVQMLLPGRSLVAVEEEKIIGFVTLWGYGIRAKTGRLVGELGSWVVDRGERRKGVGTLLAGSLVKGWESEYELAATVKTDRAMRILEGLGFEDVAFDFLEVLAPGGWRECCPCHAPAGCYQECGLGKEGECHLLVYQPERIPGFDRGRFSPHPRNLIENNYSSRETRWVEKDC